MACLFGLSCSNGTFNGQESSELGQFEIKKLIGQWLDNGPCLLIGNDA